ncbi:UNKNOWN [Stylonychia lemnae]|uniref:Uncharacterized protein n=1 Tax=Stylonychia lemnae TaxID=5949 RepID=A0A078B997_STYLE|nr:UNKNOWN [Stylonychia lemnae]|eukprot:CDW90806.1 UNKNOWN [Stylonychia lemnae]
MSESEGQYQLFGILGRNSIFMVTQCDNDRHWRRMLGVNNERYQKSSTHPFDECDNAYIKPMKPVQLDLLNNLFKKSDFE